MILIIDSGGSWIRGYLVENEKVLTAKRLEAGNISENFELATKNILHMVNACLKGREVKKVVVFVAGFAEIVTTLKEKFIHYIKETAKANSCKAAEVYSDAALPLFTTKKNVCVITLGTGTALCSRIDNEIENQFGYGHILNDPFSAYSLARRFCFEVLSKGSPADKGKLFQLFGVHNYEELITKVYNEKNTKLALADIWKNAHQAMILERFFKVAIFKESADFFNDRVIGAIERSQVVLLHGSIAISEYFRQELNKHLNSKTIVETLDNEEQTIIKVARNLI